MPGMEWAPGADSIDAAREVLRCACCGSVTTLLCLLPLPALELLCLLLVLVLVLVPSRATKPCWTGSWMSPLLVSPLLVTSATSAKSVRALASEGLSLPLPLLPRRGITW